MPIVVSPVDVGSLLDQQKDRIKMALPHGPVQWTITGFRVSAIYVCPPLDQFSHCFGVSSHGLIEEFFGRIVNRRPRIRCNRNRLWHYLPHKTTVFVPLPNVASFLGDFAKAFSSFSA